MIRKYEEINHSYFLSFRNKILCFAFVEIKNCIQNSSIVENFPFWRIHISLSFERYILVNNFPMQRRDANVVVIENSILVRTSSHLLHNAIIELVFILDAFKMFLKIRAQPRTLLRYVHDKISLRPRKSNH